MPACLERSKLLFLQDYISLELDVLVIPILPAHHNTSLLERRHLWQRHVQMDGVTRAIVMGLLSYPRTCWRITPSYLPNHKSWEVDTVKIKLGQKMAEYFFQGASEVVLQGQPLPTISKPKGSVPKKGKDKYRDISDASVGNQTIPKWSTRLFTARDLASSLRWRAIVCCHNISNGYHISMLMGCTGALLYGWGIVRVHSVYEGDPEFEMPTVPVVGEDGSVQPAAHCPHGQQAIFEYCWHLHVGFWPSNCCQTCNKFLCWFFFDSCIARWAVAHFGQAPAGSPLNCMHCACCATRRCAARRQASCAARRRAPCGASLRRVGSRRLCVLLPRAVA